MMPVKKIIIIALSILFSSVALAQHLAIEKIDSLKKLLPLKSGIARIDCLNAISEEYWWSPHVWADSISRWASEANKEALKSNYASGLAKSAQNLGVVGIYRKNFLIAEKYLQQALQFFDSIHNDRESGYCNLWLGQTFYSENNFNEAIARCIKCVPLFEKLGDGEGEGRAYAWMSFSYEATGDYDSSFYYCNKTLDIRKKMNDDICIVSALVNMGHLYKVAGAYDDALDYYRQSGQYSDSHGFNVHTAYWNNQYESIGVIYRLKNMPDSSIYYLHQALEIDPLNVMTPISFGETLLQKKQYDSALSIFLKPIEHFRKEKDQWDLMRILLDAAKAYEGKKNENAVFQYASEGFALAKNANIKPYMLQGYQLLSEVYKNMKKNDSAYFFIQQYISLKDSISNKQFLWRLTNYKKQADFQKQIDQVTILDRDNKMKEEKLQQASEIKWILLISLLIVALSGLIIYRNLALKRKNEKLENQQIQSDLQLKASELEMQALRAQMNPHFIFNCLSSINRFILKNETEAASDYLTKFSRLIRTVLTNSNKTFITLEDELDMLKLYLDMERLRFKDTFDYSITFTNSIDVDNVFVPPLLLQPFAENSIWHGLMHKQGQGHLDIALNIENKILTCIITDNGIGRGNAAMFKSKSAQAQKSMGLHITTERLALLNKDMDKQNYFNFEDIRDEEGNVAGTRVILKMQYRDLIEVST